MKTKHEANNDFVDRLEWQLTTDYRRQKRGNQFLHTAKTTRAIGVIVLVVCSMLAGVVAVKAAQQIKDSWKRKLAQAQAETAVQLKEAKLNVMQEMTAYFADRIKKGLIRQDEINAVNSEVDRAGLDLERARINLEEVKLSGQSPRDELYAPPIRGRDFVLLRLDLEKKSIDTMIQLHQVQLQQMKRRVDAGVIRKQELAAMESEINELNNTVEEILFRMALRNEFLQGISSPQEVEIKEQLSRARNKLIHAEARVTLLQGHIADMKRRVEVGMIPASEVNYMYYELTAAEAEKRLASLEVDLLNSEIK